MRYPHRIKQVLAASPDVKHFVAQHLQTVGERVESVISETAGKAGLLEPIAAALETAQHIINLEDWVQHQESILVLGTSHRRRPSLSAYNRAIITLLSDIILEGEELKHQYKYPYLRHWFILDEVHTLERIDVLPQLLSQGRSKGVCSVLTFHAIGQLHRIYGKDGTGEILDSINNKLFLRVSDPETERYIQEEMGVRDLWEMRRSFQYSWVQNRDSWSEAEHRETRPLVLGSESSDLPLSSREVGIPGFAKIPDIGRYRMTIPGDLIESRVPSSNGSVSLWYRDREHHEYLLADLTDQEKAMLQIDDQVLEARQKTQQKPPQVVAIEEKSAFPESPSKRSAKSSKRRDNLW
jgi:hypothetical protein